MKNYIKKILSSFLLTIIFFIVFPSDVFAGTLSVSQTASTITVTSSNTPSWKVVFDENEGGTANEFYYPSGGSSNLILSSGSNRMQNMFGLVTRDNATSYCDSTTILRLMEYSPTRVVIKTAGKLMEFSSGTCQAGEDGDYEQWYALYPDRIMVYGTFSDDTGGTGFSGPYSAFDSNTFDSNLNVSDDNSTNTTVTTSAAVQTITNYGYNDPGMAHTLTGLSAAAGTSNDYLFISYEVPSFFPVDEFYYVNDVNSDTQGFITDDGITATTTYNYSYMFKLTDDNTSDGSEARSYGQDYWNPDSLNDGLVSGSGWNGNEEQTNIIGNDFFNEYEGTYNLQAVNSAELLFGLDGGTYNRYSPIIKSRSWRRRVPVSSFYLQSVPQAETTNFNTNIAPFSEAWAYDSGGSYVKIGEAGYTSSSDEYLYSESQDYDFGTLAIFDSSADYLYLGHHDKLTGVNFDWDTLGIGSAEITWQYCSNNADESTACDGWSNIIISETFSDVKHLKKNGAIYFNDIGGFKQARVNNGRQLYWIRGYLSSGSFSTYPKENTITPDVMITQYLGDITSDDRNFNLFGVVDAVLTFVINAVDLKTVTNEITTSVSSTFNSLPFSNLAIGVPKYAAHQLEVTTTAEQGYTVSMKLSNNLQGLYPANYIDPFAAAGATWETPIAWTEPNGTIPNTNTGWIGANTSDAYVTGWSSGSGKFGPVSTISHEVMYNSEHEEHGRSIYVTYAIEVNNMQPSDIYSSTLRYTALPRY